MPFFFREGSACNFASFAYQNELGVALDVGDLVDVRGDGLAAHAHARAVDEVPILLELHAAHHQALKCLRVCGVGENRRGYGANRCAVPWYGYEGQSVGGCELGGFERRWAKRVRTFSEATTLRQERVQPSMQATSSSTTSDSFWTWVGDVWGRRFVAGVKGGKGLLSEGTAAAGIGLGVWSGRVCVCVCVKADPTWSLKSLTSV